MDTTAAEVDGQVDAADAGTTALPGWARVGTQNLLLEQLSESQAAELADVVDHAGRLLDDALEVRLDEVDDFASASAALGLLWQAVTRAVTSGGRAADRFMSATSAADLLSRIRGSEQAVTAAERRYGDGMVARARAALGEIQRLSTVEELIQAAPRAICSIGFDRALLSSIEYSTWLTDAAHIDGDPEWAQQIVDAGRATPQSVIPGLPETHLVRDHEPILVTGAHERRDVHKAVVDAAAGRSYVAAAIMPRSKVVGFLHGDRIFHRGDTTEFDAQVLGIFAQGYSFALERAITLSDLQELRGHVRGFTQGIESFVRSATTNAGLGLGALRGGGVSPLAPPPVPAQASPPRDADGIARRPLDELLTRRELEVLSLMAEGDNNQRIAQRLVIADETVKSHVKNILRKLRVSSRVAAVARWHQWMGGAR